MKPQPYIIRLRQMIEDLPDLAETLADATNLDEETLAAMNRIGLAHAIVTRLGSDSIDGEALNDPAMGVAVTQKELQDISTQGYQTAFSREAVAVQALEMLFQSGQISEDEVPQYTSGELDPSEKIEGVLAEHGFVEVESAPGHAYFLCPHF